MENNFFSTSEINSLREKKKDIKKLNKEDIAIIGISGKYASTCNLEEFWTLLQNGQSGIRSFSKERLDKIDCQAMHLKEDKIIPAGYMDEIDTFDHEFFGLSMRESKTIDPGQRILLQMIWEAIEEAGYGGELIKGSKTGIFIGYSSDHKVDYCTYLKQAAAVDEDEISLAGNVKSVLGSRIAYLLDLKGPSLVVDTACSSVLSALHLACNSIKQGESDMALVGGININILPVQRGLDDVVGIRSPENRIRAFDEGGNGIASGEGAGVILLKPLAKAIEDKDHIHAIIKGSAMNQDGTSIGITAPNALAQEEVMVKAWQQAKVDPMTISYIEAHGTGTKLGDPIEIDSITRAFRRYTDRKNFCAIGSLKTNIGHLDGAAGIASIMKAILMLKHKTFVSSLYFMRPNKKIDFVNSPVYVNDKCMDWKSEGPRRCGIAAFGLSGTNCHVVLEEYIDPKVVDAISESHETAHIFTISAKDKEGLKNLAKKYLLGLEKHLVAESIRDICYTSNIGRKHLEHRLALVVSNHEDLLQGLKAFLDEVEEAHYDYGFHKIVSYQKAELLPEELNTEKLNALNSLIEQKIELLEDSTPNQKEIYKQIGQFYVNGGMPNWQSLYSIQGHKVSLPTYPFKKISCWPKLKQYHRKNMFNKDYPLLNGEAIVSMNSIIYTCYLNETNWVIGEHLINGQCVLPGVAYIEILVQILKQMGRYKKGIKVSKFMLMNPFAIEKGQEKELQVVLNVQEKVYMVQFLSPNKDEKWTVHAEGKLEVLEETLQVEAPSLDAILSKRGNKIDFNTVNKVVDIGEHWQSIAKEVYQYEDGYIVYFALNKAHEQEVKEYSYHPALMDRGINATIDFIKKDTYFLPFNYESLILLKTLPETFYSVVKTKEYKGEEIAVLDVTLYDMQGNVIGQANNYSVKCVNKKYNIKPIKPVWQITQAEDHLEEIPKGLVVVGEKNQVEIFSSTCTGKGISKAIPVYLTPDITEADLAEVIDQIHASEITDIVYLADDSQPLMAVDTIKANKKMTVESLFLLLHTLIMQGIRKEMKLLVVLKHAYKLLDEETEFNPYHTSLAALAKVANQEQPKLLIKVIDTDDVNRQEIIFEELCHNWQVTKRGYRNNKCYEESLQTIEEDMTLGYEDYKQDGIYIITGGTGDLGGALAKHLVTQKPINLALLSRNAKEKGKELVLEIEKLGGHIELINVDISHYEGLKEAINALRNKYGCIRGIFHCAGIVSKGLIMRENQEAFNEVLSSKMEGTIYLDQLTRVDHPDFMIYFSSINALTGGIGQGDYAAANAFLDGYSLYRNSQGYKTLSINWPGWKDIGMAKRHNAFKEDDLLEGIYSKEALPFIERLLMRDENQFIVGKLQQVKNKGIVEQERDIDVNLTTTENKVAQIWKTILEVDAVGILDSFSELGGDSIMANYLYKQLEQQFPGVLDITDVFSYPTIKQMAQIIDDKINSNSSSTTNEENEIKRTTKVSEDDIDDLLSKLASGKISVDEMSQLF